MNRARGTEALRWLRHALKWLALGMGVALLAGTASAWFLLALAWATEIRLSALAAGMKTLRQDGIEKVLQGLTDMSEVTAATNL